MAQKTFNAEKYMNTLPELFAGDEKEKNRKIFKDYAKELNDILKAKEITKPMVARFQKGVTEVEHVMLLLSKATQGSTSDSSITKTKALLKLHLIASRKIKSSLTSESDIKRDSDLSQGIRKVLPDVLAKEFIKAGGENIVENTKQVIEKYLDATNRLADGEVLVSEVGDIRKLREDFKPILEILKSRADSENVYSVHIGNTFADVVTDYDKVPDMLKDIAKDAKKAEQEEVNSQARAEALKTKALKKNAATQPKENLEKRSELVKAQAEERGQLTEKLKELDKNEEIVKNIGFLSSEGSHGKSFPNKSEAEDFTGIIKALAPNSEKDIFLESRDSEKRYVALVSDKVIEEATQTIKTERTSVKESQQHLNNEVSKALTSPNAASRKIG